MLRQKILNRNRFYNLEFSVVTFQIIIYAKSLTFPLAVLNDFIIIGNAVNASWKLAFFLPLFPTFNRSCFCAGIARMDLCSPPYCF